MPELTADPIIVYGAPRSGTTYLQQILNSHPEVFISDETRVFAWLFQAVEMLPLDERLVVTNREEFIDRLRSVLPGSIRDFYRSLAPDARYWGDKNPHYADLNNGICLETVAWLYPGSRFIHIIRDGRDVAASILRKRHPTGKRWMPKFRGAHYTWMSIVDRGSAFGRWVDPSRYLELRYEGLVADDLALSKEIFEFLDIDFHPDVVSFLQSELEERTPFKGPTRDLSQGVMTSDWARLFGPEERAESLDLIGSRLVRLGYETEASLAQLRKRIREGSTEVHDPD
jgi:protein-tyrosine sulfotransferase